jgi:PAS domain S-box-containing protein
LVILALTIGSAIAFQLLAAVMAFKLIRLPSTGLAWSLIATALALMATRRIVSFHYLTTGSPATPPDLLHEFIGLLVSICMLAGIVGIGPLFSFIKRAEAALRKSEEKYRELVENANSVIIRINGQGKITFFNQYAQKFFGYNQAEIIGRDAVGAIVPKTDSAGHDLAFMMKDIIEHPEQYSSNENENICKDGRKVWMSWTNTAICEDDGSLVGILSVGNDVTERKKTEEERRRTGERLRTLSQQLMEAQESERRHLARELHDEIGQALTMVKINLQTIQSASDPALIAQRTEESIGIIEQTLQQVRNLSLDLRPSLLDDLGLIAALRWYLDRQAKGSGFVLHFSADSLDKRLPADIETACFRIVQEAITNIVKYSQAKEVHVDLRQGDKIMELTIRDTGIGFNVKSAQARAAEGGRLGLLSMAERVSLVGGTFNIQSEPGKGTEIRACLPVE